MYVNIEMPGMVGNFTILLDNSEVFGCVEANDKEGWLVQHKRDDNGQLMIDPDNTNTTLKERITGNIEIKWTGESYLRIEEEWRHLKGYGRLG